MIVFPSLFLFFPPLHFSSLEIKLEWGKGLAQKREAEARLQELESEKDKPFARTRDDPELDKMLRERIRDGDPMAHLVKKKRPELVLPNLGDNEKMKESGFVVPQDIPDHSWLKRRLDAAPNRYGIRPGRHWDGVDRSNGFEKGLFKRMNEKRATETEAYLCCRIPTLQRCCNNPGCYMDYCRSIRIIKFSVGRQLKTDKSSH
ncbi:hypothetical protein CMV_020159 [Castanea mollissima]|uniref:BUD13 homolog n=1 Tax=Castanea mollissima TaxID=60419 RepID=A0A8J4VG12_9ROSI|nr:hypothetical protein CMV_020159 [Castanea mollissima]